MWRMILLFAIDLLLSVGYTVYEDGHIRTVEGDGRFQVRGVVTGR